MPKTALTYRQFTGGKVDPARFSPTSATPIAAEDCMDVVPLPSGAITKRPGERTVNQSDFGTDAMGMAWCRSADSASFILLVKEKTSTTYTLRGFETDDANFPLTCTWSTYALVTDAAWGSGYLSSVAYKNVLYMVDGTAAQKLTYTAGTTPDWDMAQWTHATFPAGATMICLHYDRIYAAGATGEKNRIQFSKIADPNTWTETNDEDNADEGGYFDLDAPVTAMVSHERCLYIFTRNSIYRMRNTPPWHEVDTVSESVGCIGQFTAVECGTGRLAFLAADGVRVLYSHNLAGDALSDPVEPTLRGVEADAPSTFYVPCAVYDPLREAYILSYSTSGVNDSCLMISFKGESRGCWPLTAVARCYLNAPAQDVPELATDPGVIYCKSGTGYQFVYCLPSVAKTGSAGDDYDSSGITQAAIDSYWTAHMTDGGEPMVRKAIERAVLNVSSTGDESGATTTMTFYISDRFGDSSPTAINGPTFTANSEREEFHVGGGGYMFGWKWRDTGKAQRTLYGVTALVEAMQ